MGLGLEPLRVDWLDQYESELSASAPALEPRAQTVGSAVDDLRNRTEPSHMAMLAPPLW